jgi:hypothetical protein
MWLKMNTCYQILFISPFELYIHRCSNLGINRPKFSTILWSKLLLESFKVISISCKNWTTLQLHRLLRIVDVLWNRVESLAISNDPPSVLTVATAKEISSVEQHMDYYVIKASQTYTDMLCVCMSRSRMYMATLARQNSAGVNTARYVGERVEQVLSRADQLTRRQQQF